MAQEKLEDINFHEWFAKYNENREVAPIPREPIPIGGDTWLAAFAAWQYSEILSKQKSGTQALEDEIEFLRLAFFRMYQCLGPADAEIVASIKQEFTDKTGKQVPGRYCE